MLLLFLFGDLSRNRSRLSPFGFTRRPVPPVCSIVPNGRRSECGKIGNIPPSSQCFDQKHTRVQSTALDIYGVSLVGELDRLRGDDLEVGVAALNSRAAIFTILSLVSAASFLDFHIYRL